MLARFPATWPMRPAGFELPTTPSFNVANRGLPQKWRLVCSKMVSEICLPTSVRLECQRGADGGVTPPSPRPAWPRRGRRMPGPCGSVEMGTDQRSVPTGTSGRRGRRMPAACPHSVTRCRSGSRQTSLHLPTSRALTPSACQTCGRRPPPCGRRPASKRSCRRPRESRHRS
jgi:hypothetical protein